MELHAKLSASGSDRWLICPGSIKACEGLESASSVYAEEGTKAHEHAAIALINGEDAKIPDDLDMQDHVQSYLYYVRRHLLEDSKLLVETRVDYSKWVKNGFGTLDCAIINGNEAHIIDLKYGQGQLITADDTNQLKIYAMGLHSEYPNIEMFHLHIVQPRKYSYTTYDFSLSELLLYADWVKERAILTEDPNAPRIPSEKGCKWCLAKNNCPKLLEHTEMTITQQFDNLQVGLPSPDSLTNEQIIKIVKNKELIIDFMKSVEERLFEKVSAGENDLGYKIVEAKTNRKWSDEAETALVSMIGEKAYTKKLIGITEASRLIDKKIINEFTVKPKGAPVLAPEDDSREAIKSLEFDPQ